MKSFVILASIAPAVMGFALERRAVCNADNCARAVTGTAFGSAVLSTHMAQCSSYFSATVIPPVTTVWNPVATSYVFSTLGADLSAPIERDGPAGTSTTVIPTNIPDFASAACDGNTTPVPIRYSSACSCAGITKATGTAAAPTTIQDITATVTVSTFLIQATGIAIAEPEYLYSTTDPYGSGSIVVEFTTDITQASGFVLAGDELQLLSNGFIADENSKGAVEALYFDNSTQVGSHGSTAVAITIGQDLSISLSNAHSENSFTEDCKNLLYVNAADDLCSGKAVSLSAVPL